MTPPPKLPDPPPPRTAAPAPRPSSRFEARHFDPRHRQLPHFLAVLVMEFSTTDAVIVFGHCSRGCRAAAQAVLTARRALIASRGPANPLATAGLARGCAKLYESFYRHLHDTFDPVAGARGARGGGVPGMTWEEAAYVERPQVVWPSQHAAAAGAPVSFLTWTDRCVVHGTQTPHSAGGAAVGCGRCEHGVTERHFAAMCIFVHTGYGVSSLLMMLFFDAASGVLADCYWSLRVAADSIAMARSPLETSDAVMSSSVELFADLVHVDASHRARLSSSVGAPPAAEGGSPPASPADPPTTGAELRGSRPATTAVVGTGTASLAPSGRGVNTADATSTTQLSAIAPSLSSSVSAPSSAAAPAAAPGGSQPLADFESSAGNSSTGIEAAQWRSARSMPEVIGGHPIDTPVGQLVPPAGALGSAALGQSAGGAGDACAGSATATLGAQHLVVPTACLLRFSFADHIKAVGAPHASCFPDQAAGRVQALVRLAAAAAASSTGAAGGDPLGALMAHVGRDFLDPVGQGVGGISCKLYRPTEVMQHLTTPKGVWMCTTNQSELVEVDFAAEWEHRARRLDRLMRRHWTRGLESIWRNGYVPIGALLPWSVAPALL